ncbi:MAG: DUF2452 domain-containing protein [Pseudomonadota bacterium]
MKKIPNPQGKGLTPLLTGLADARPNSVLPPKQINQITNELFTSLFVLSARFEFKPVRGKSYWLYLVDNEFRLFAISPDSWSGKVPGQYIGECILQEDITWTIELDELVVNEKWFNDLIDEERKRIVEQLELAKNIETAMPAYNIKIRYYQRLLMYGLGISLKTSMQRAGINQLAYQDAAALLTTK